MRSIGQDPYGLGATQPVVLGPSIHYPYWIEAVWADRDGTLLAWYHHEPQGVCPGLPLTAPEIGALLSEDAGKTFIDLGIILESGDAADCCSRNHRE